MCEAKFYDEPFEIKKAYEAQLRQKIATLKQHHKSKNNYFITFITPYGVVPNAYALSLGAYDVRIDALFR